MLDTSVAVALADRRDSHHQSVAAWMETVDLQLVTTPLAAAEMDHMVSRAGGVGAASALYDDFARGIYSVEWWPEAMRETVEIARKNSGLAVGLTDASLVALAARLGTIKIATLDERHFRAVRPASGESAFTLLPADH